MADSLLRLDNHETYQGEIRESQCICEKVPNAEAGEKPTPSGQSAAALFGNSSLLKKLKESYDSMLNKKSILIQCSNKLI